MKKSKKFRSYFAGSIAAILTLANCNITTWASDTAQVNSKSSFKQIIQFEDANHFSSDNGNAIKKELFGGYSGSGFVYLAKGWSDVNFTVPSDGKYKITIVTNSDQYKENGLYLDDSSAGKLCTNAGSWNTTTNEYTLSKGQHKFGVSSDWGYVALDYIIVESIDNNNQDGQTGTIPDVSSDKVVCEFENANSFSTNSGNKIANDTFKGYSGNGYVYLASGWSETKFNIKEAGKYKLTISSNSDQYKENWLYLDNNSAGKLCTNPNTWNKTEYVCDLSAGEHKFGVSSNWGHVALDNVTIEKVNSTPTNPTDPTNPIPKSGFYVKGTKLYDGNGNEFVMRGVNISHAWYTSNTEKSINAVAKLGANTVRVVLADGTQWTKTNVDEVKNIIALCKQKGLVCILEVHDHTGFDDPQRLYTAVDYWVGLKDILNANKDFVIVNVANEWLGTWNKGDVWANTYCTAIKKMRNAGIENVIMVDAAGYGQETSSLIEKCKTVKDADKTGKIMFSIHMYSVAGANSTVVKSNIDNMLSKGVCTAIGEFGDFQNGGDVDEATIINYSDEKKVGTMAWSWKGNGGQDATLDLSNDWEGTNLTTWGKYAFSSEHGIQKTSKLAYSLKGYDGIVVTPTQPTQPTQPTNPVPDENVEINIKPGYLGSLTTDWYVSGKGDATTSTISSLKELKNGGYRLSFDLATEQYPYFVNMANGVDLSKNNKINVIVRNNNAYAVQLQPIFKVGDEWEWTEYDKYQTIPALTTVQLSFDMSKCTARNDVKAFLFRVQGAGSKFAGSVDFLSVGCDLATDAYKSEIAELNRPKTASYFTWNYPEASWKDQTTTTSCSEDSVLGVEFKNVTAKNAAGIQTETKPGLGQGLDCSPYKTITCTITNNSSTDVSASLLLRTTSNWTWQENGGIIDNKVGNDIIPAGKSVKATYNLTDSIWKSALSNWDYTAKLQAPDDVRAIGFKIWSNSTTGANGKVAISNFAFNF